MKYFLSITLILTAFVFGISAQSRGRVELKAGESTTAMKGKLHVKFIGVGEDSRCPAGTTCVWAGNAKVGIQVWKKGGKPADLTLNTTLDPRTVTYLGFKITLITLSPRTTSSDIDINGTARPEAESTAVFEITKS
ncbi:MAG: hypothetical protein ACRD43_09100 [Pyrinomonadaceae bacterium]